MESNNKNGINSWATKAHNILMSKSILDEEQKRAVIELFGEATVDDISYRKIRILAMIKCGSSDEDIISYLRETVSIFPYKPWIYSHFFLLGDKDSVDRIFRCVTTNMRCFVWDDQGLERISEIVGASLATPVYDVSTQIYKCSCCGSQVRCHIPNKAIYMDMFTQWLSYARKEGAGTKKIIILFYSWLTEIAALGRDYTVVIDGANIGRMIRHKNGPPVYSDIDKVIKILELEGEKPIVVLNEIHKNNYQGDTTNIIWSPKRISDDICWMALSLIKAGANFVTGDHCSNWQSILSGSIAKTGSMCTSDEFRIWVDTYKRRISHLKGKFSIEPYKGYSETSFIGESGNCHLPYDNLRHPGKWMCYK